MNVLLISRPGISLLRSLRESETAWDAIRFYEPLSLSIGVYIQVSTLAGAISLSSDLRFFLRKYTSDHLFQIKPGIFCTAALIRSRYLTRNNDFSQEWPYRLVYWIENIGRVTRFRKGEFNSEDFFSHSDNEQNITKNDSEEYPLERSNSIPSHNEIISCGYLVEVWCTKPEFDMV